MEPELMLGKDACLISRLCPATSKFSGAVRLTFHSRGALSNLYIEPQQAPRTACESNVTIRVRSVGLNFRDVLNVLGEYPGDPGPPGGDCAGVVSDTTPAESEMLGQLICGLAYAPLASLATASLPLLASKPATLTFEEASTLPITWRCEHASTRKAFADSLR